MDRAAICLRMRYRRQQRRVLVERARLNRHVDAHDVHQHNAAGAEVQVTDFAVAHLPVRQADKVVARPQQGIRKIAQQAVINRLACQRDCIAFGVGPVAPAVKNRQNNRFRHVCSQDTKSMARTV